MGKLGLIPGGQTGFVETKARFAAYLAGIGAGKTYAGIAKGLAASLQPKPPGVFHPPHGLIAAASYPHLRDTIIPKLQEMVTHTGLADWERDYKRAAGVMELTLVNGAKIRLRSLDKPDKIVRGPEYTWVFIDEGRNVTLNSWKLVTGRLRQKGYNQQAFVASTTNGFDWMYDVFHPDGSLHDSEYSGAEMFTASTLDNPFLDQAYLDSLQGTYSGRWYEQEVLGHFIGLVSGGVFPDWDPVGMCRPLHYRPELPLYSFWDFGVGDPGVLVFAQVEYLPVVVSRPDEFPQRVKMFPNLYILAAHEHKDWTAHNWAELYHHELLYTFEGARTRGDFGDPAGTQRNPSTGTSVIEDLNAAGVPVLPAMRRKQDYAIRILQNLHAAGRVVVNEHGAKRMSDAFSSHKWHIKDDVRIGTNPVHDWTSHYVDAVRYGVSELMLFTPLDEAPRPEQDRFEPNQYGYVFQQMEEQEEEVWMGGAKPRPTFIAPQIRIR